MIQSRCKWSCRYLDLLITTRCLSRGRETDRDVGQVGPYAACSGRGRRQREKKSENDDWAFCQNRLLYHCQRVMDVHSTVSISLYTVFQKRVTTSSTICWTTTVRLRNLLQRLLHQQMFFFIFPPHLFSAAALPWETAETLYHEFSLALLIFLMWRY